jgi:hypothetical protein
MKNIALILTVSLFTMSAYADHHGGGGGYGCNYAEAANLTYRLADIGESYASSYDYQISNTANALHHSASNLFYALRSQGGVRLFDHHGGGHNSYFQLLEQVRYNVNAFAQYAPYQVASEAVSLFEGIRSYLNCGF